MPAGSGPRQIAPGPGQTLWVTLETTQKLLRVADVAPPPPGGEVFVAGDPRTRIVRGPRGKVLLRGKRRRRPVGFRFASPDAGARFQCRLIRRTRRAKASRHRRGLVRRSRFNSCKPPRRYRLRPGRYRFEVRAVVDGRVDRSPARRSFRIVRKRRR